MKKILIVDDEIEMLDSLEKILLRRKDFKLKKISDPQIALNEVKKTKYDLIITDLKLKDLSGIDILRASLNKFPESTVIMISGYGTIEASVEAMKEGAFDFIEKPFTSQKLFESIDRALDQGFGQGKEFDAANEELQKHIGMVYKSDMMVELLENVKKIAPGNMNILVTGESGTGKELIARAVHILSKRKVEPFVPINCGALPEHLFESELFGHERGAFTGAVKTKPGLLEFANQGTFFFDEIGEMTFPLQVKLLRMLEDKKIRRVGGEKEINIDVRIIAATNANLEQAVADKKFRQDLFYRLNTIKIEVPPLRERVDDILPLAYHFLKELSGKNDKIVRGFSSHAENALLNYSWPGNVRELMNMIERAYFLTSANVIQKSDLPLPDSNELKCIDKQLLNLPYKDAKEKILEKFEVEYLTYHLGNNKGNISHTADFCGIDRRSIHRLVIKHNIIYKE